VILKSSPTRVYILPGAPEPDLRRCRAVAQTSTIPEIATKLVTKTNQMAFDRVMGKKIVSWTAAATSIT
jgi:hypothetical protein